MTCTDQFTRLHNAVRELEKLPFLERTRLADLNSDLADLVESDVRLALLYARHQHVALAAASRAAVDSETSFLAGVFGKGEALVSDLALLAQELADPRAVASAVDAELGVPFLTELHEVLERHRPAVVGRFKEEDPEVAAAQWLALGRRVRTRLAQLVADKDDDDEAAADLFARTHDHDAGDAGDLGVTPPTSEDCPVCGHSVISGYTCAEHNEHRQAGPGKCPICDKALERFSNVSASAPCLRLRRGGSTP